MIGKELYNLPIRPYSYIPLLYYLYTIIYNQEGRDRLNRFNIKLIYLSKPFWKRGFTWKGWWWLDAITNCISVLKKLRLRKILTLKQMTTNKSKKVRCLVCNEILTYENDDTSVLVDHLNLEHSGLDVFRFLAHCQVSNSKINRKTISTERACTLEAGDSINDSRVYKNPSKTLKSTVEGWTPGPQNIVCPKCGKEGQPVIKKQKNKMAKTPLGALCMLGCWPFCFLPFLFRRDQFLDLYCSCCKSYIGTYDKRKCCMIRPQNKSSESSLDKCNAK